MDLISREEVEKITWEEPSYTDPLNILTEIREKVRKLPSQNKWISVKERLPEEGTECLVTVLHNEPYSFKYEYKVKEAYYAEYWGLYDDDYSGARILAWMPLPEPYKESEE